MSFEPIAIVGRGCVLPGALTPAQLWEVVRAGKDLVRPAPAGALRVGPSRVFPRGAAHDGTWSDRGGYVEGFEAVFDPTGFATPPEALLGLDPLFQWLLHVCREALREASLGGNAGGGRVGAVFGNLSFPSSSLARYAERVFLGDALADAAGIAPADPRNRFTSGLPAHLVAQALGLGGGAFCLDAACASSLYAIKLACDRLHDHSADVMIAGGVNGADRLFLHVGFCALQALSKTGRSRPFHRGADGLVPAEGAGAVVLKRLADAEAAGNRVFGVLRGVGLSGCVSSLLAPSEEGQVRAMRSAYEMAGLLPSGVSMLECHATGTPLGDAAEIRSMRRVFESARELPIGSIKSNFGHALTAAGMAGLLKILGAMEHRVRPPTLHAEEPIAELSGSPFRLLHAPEPWEEPHDGEGEAPRRAALSAFGFGGNHAHLIVEEHRVDAKHRCTPARVPAPLPAPGVGSRRAYAAPPGRRPTDVAIVAVGAAVGNGRSVADFEAALFSPADETGRAAHRRATSIALPATAVRFPPRDLELALAQQTFVLAAAQEALAAVTIERRDRAGAFVGIGCEPEVARYAASFRLSDWAKAWGVEDQDWLLQTAEAFAPTLVAAGVLGTLPNVAANRLNVQLDLGGPGMTITAEELSGVRALELAARALETGELDLALVGAADFSCAPAHEAALRALGLRHETGDAAVVLVLERAEDARRGGRPILALLDADRGIEGTADVEEIGLETIERRFGRAHAAFGLVCVAAATLACARGRRLGGEPWPGARAARIEIEALLGQRATVIVRGDGEIVAASHAAAVQDGTAREYRAHADPITLPPFPMQDAPSASLNAVDVYVDVDVDETTSRRLSPSRVRWAPDVRGAAACRHALGLPLRPPTPPPGTQVMAPAPLLPPVQEEELWEDPRQAGPILQDDDRSLDAHRSDEVATASPQALVARIHRQFLEGQARVHHAFLEMRERATAALLAAPSARGPQERRPAQSDLPGLKLDRRGLTVHASGRISEIFGPLFAPQDSYQRQVRMPEPPLLLADRLIGLDAKAGSMGKGTLWTETDVQQSSWYLHEGRMPAGIMVEAGQADLMLISYLGADLLNRGERVYRLLGCDLTFHGPLPVPGDTLRYDIHVDSHARQGDVRLFFFHYDCQIAGRRRLSVRNGEAGFFTDRELAESEGVLWDPATAAPQPDATVDSPAVLCERSQFRRQELEAFAAGRVRECFGRGFERAATHTRTPRIAGGRMLLLEQVTDFAPRGGPWGRGYLRAIEPLRASDWFFQGHFKNDPCMPGTLMLEGCLQAMALYMTGLGLTLDKDGWRFEPVPEQRFRMRCRGQATPQSREVVYEVFVEEVVAGPAPKLYADLLVTVDGLKAFHCRRMGLALVPRDITSQPYTW